MRIKLNQEKFRKTLFNIRDFKKQLRHSTSPISCFRKTINNARAILDERFKSNVKIETLIRDMAWLVDQILAYAWKQYDWKDAEDISLVAVGGYGRGELHPYSDIDIQILLKRKNHKKYRDNIEKFLTFLWDINLEIGQSVRTIKESEQEAANDITVATSLMESRTVIGSPGLHKKLMLQLSQKKIWKTKEFFAAKVSEQLNRHKRHDHIAYALEPDIKVAPGGLRDIQTIGWIAKRYYDAPNFTGLVERGFLQKSEFSDLIRGRNFLWKIRYGLHMITGRREDRLLFEHQHSLATIFGYKDDKKSLGIEKLMQEYYRIVLTLRVLNDVLLQLFDEDIIRSSEKVKIKPLNNRFQIRNNYIEVVHTRVFRQTPPALLEIFVLMAQNPDIEGIRASTIRLIRNGRQLIDAKFRNDIRNTSLFMELLRSPYKLVARLRQMKRYGILSAYLPEFGKIVGQMQHDLFHIYTVDDHILQVLENMRRLRHPEAEEKFPIAAQIVKRLPKIELLYIAGLYHDIAKGRGGDHSILGVADSEKFCKRHHLGNWDTRLVGWLVADHLVMSSVAQREDIQDPEIIRDFALKVGDQTRLDYLYALTVADINATNPSLWNTWRASLLRQLYLLTKRALSQGLEKIVGKADWIKENQLMAISILKERGFTKKKVLKIWNNPDEDYFLRESAENIAWHTEAISRHLPENNPLILIKDSIEHQYEGATQIFIYSLNSKFLFANITNALDRLNLNIQDAKLFNSDSEYSMKTFMVLEADGKPIGKNPCRVKDIKAILKLYIETPQLKPESTGMRTPRNLRGFTRNTETTLTDNPNTPYSILEVLCPDRPGLLAIVANIFVDMNITLHNAKITTLGENVEDVFFISDDKNKPLRDTKITDKLQKSIREKLDAQIQL